MRNLFSFLIRNSSWLLAILLVVFGFYLVFSHNSYQRSVYLSSSNRVSAWFYSTSNKVNGFFYLQKNNRELLENCARLEKELFDLKQRYTDVDTDSTSLPIFVTDTTYHSQFNFIPAEVINMSFSGANNFMTINKGTLHGVKADMGVISPKGIVGVVLKASRNASVVIPVINPKFRLSAKLYHSENTGSMSWDGNNIKIAQLNELPKHQPFEPGDTVVTSFSSIFPKDIVIGFVTQLGKSKDDKFNTLNLQLATDFHTLQHVLIIEDVFYEEQKALEESIN